MKEERLNKPFKGLIRFMAKWLIMETNYHLYVIELVKAYSDLTKRVEELEAEVAKLQGKKKKCVILELKPRKTS